METVDKLKQTYIDSTYTICDQQLKQLSNEIDRIVKPKELSEFIPYIERLKAKREQISSFKLVMDVMNVKALVDKAFERSIEEWEQKEYDINTKYEDLLDSKIQSLEDEAKEMNKVKMREFNESNQVYIDLENKRKQLESYSDEIIDICKEYNITTNDVDIDNSSFTVAELNDVYDKYLDYIRKRTSKVNFITTFRERIPNIYVQIGILFIIVVLACTRLLDLGAIVFYVLLAMSQKVSQSKIKSFIVLYGLVFNVQPMQMGFKDEIDEGELVSEKIDEDKDSRLNELTEQWSEEIDKLDKENPSELAEQCKAALISEMPAMEKEFAGYIKDIEDKKKVVMDKMDTEIQRAREEFEELKNNVKLLGQSVSQSSALDTNFRLGIYNEVMEEKVDVGLQNIVIKPTADLAMHKKFLQVLLANAMCNVQINLLTAIIVDPNRQGQELVSFYNSNLEDLIVFSRDSLDKIIDELKVFADNNMKQMQGLDINTFNKQAEETGRTPREYRLLIVLSQPKKVEEDEALTEFMSYSARYGVIVWIVSNKNIANTKVFKRPFEGVEHPYDIQDMTFGKEVSTVLAKEREDHKEKALTWKRFCEIAAPDDKIWSQCADDHVTIMPGFEEGDPEKHIGYSFGNEGNVHMLGVGGTGAGKSVFLNFVVCELTRLYSPRDLELWMIDFKGNEFVKYLPKPGHPAMLPHMKACLCTSDGDYAGSVFKALRKETERRFDLFRGKVKNLKQWNEQAKAEGRIGDILPRVLCINDEFQVIFEKGDPKVVDQIKEDITYIAKLGRAAGVHMFFTSQSMTGTMKQDILDQFTLRFALRCSMDVSQSILGTKYAGEIRQKNGYLYVRSVDDKSLQSQKRFKTPYLCDEGPDEKHPNRVDELQEHIDMVAELAVKQGYEPKDVITYLESTKHPIAEVDSFYEAHYDQIQPAFFLMGERMAYSANRAPDNFILTATNNMHIFSVFSNLKDFVNFYKTIKRNIDLNKHCDSNILINSQVADLHYLCNIDEDYEGVTLAYSTEKTSPLTLLQFLFAPLYQARKQANVKKDPVYIILLGWDKAIGFGVDKDSSLVSEYVTLMQLCGEYNIHFIFICTSGGQIPPSVVNACQYRIAGKVSSDDSSKVLDSVIASKSFADMKDSYMYIAHDGEIRRDKLYLSEQTREVKSNELVLGG